MKTTLFILVIATLFAWISIDRVSATAKPIKKIWMVSLCYTGHISTPLAFMEQLLVNMKQNNSKFEYKISIVTQPICKEKSLKQFEPYQIPVEYIASSPDIISKQDMDKFMFDESLGEGAKFSMVWSRQFMPIAERDYELLVPFVINNETRPDLMLIDSFSMGAKLLAKDFGIPWIHSHPTITARSGESPSYPFIAAPGIMGRMSVWERIHNLFLSYSLLPAVYNVLSSINIPYRTRYNFPPVSFNDFFGGKIDFIATAVGASYVFPNYKPNEFYFGAVLSPGMLEQAAKTQYPTEFKSWLQQRVIYVSMGTVVKMSQRQFQTMLESFSKLPQYTFIWSIPKYQQQEFLQNNQTIPSHIHLVTWAPQLPLLLHPNVSLFVSHAGGNSFHESLYAGKPMVTLPSFFDQLHLSGVVEYRKLGKRLETTTFTSQQMQEAIVTVMEEEEYTKNAKRMSNVLKMAGGTKRAAEVIEELIELNGDFSHLIPCIQKLPWLERTSIDLWVIALVTLYVVYKVLKWIVRIIIRSAVEYLPNYLKQNSNIGSTEITEGQLSKKKQ